MSTLRELELGVLNAAKKWLAMSRDPIDDSNDWMRQTLDAVLDLKASVEALDAYVPPTVTGRGAKWAAGSETSRQAAFLADPAQKSTRLAIIAHLVAPARLALGGYTDEELERRLRKSHQTVSAARNWLVEAGWVVDSGQRRKNQSGRKATVWSLSEAGFNKVRFRGVEGAADD